jgi:transposase
MDARTVNNLPPAATHDGAARCLMAIELSKKSWIIGVNTPLSDKIGKHTVKGRKELAELLDKISHPRWPRAEASGRVRQLL